MLTRLDDYPGHQAPEPLAHTLSASLNQYDRSFFSGYTRDGEIVSATASRRAPIDPTETQVGP